MANQNNSLKCVGGPLDGDFAEDDNLLDGLIPCDALLFTDTDQSETIHQYLKKDGLWNYQGVITRNGTQK